MKTKLSLTFDSCVNMIDARGHLNVSCGLPKSMEHSRKTNKQETSCVYEWIYWMCAICDKNSEHLAGDVDLVMTHLFRGEIVRGSF